MQLLLSPLLHHIPYTSVTQGPYYLKEINQEPSYGTAFLMPAPPNIDSSDSYTRRSQTTVPMCCFPPNPQFLTLRLAHGVLGKGLGWKAPAPPVSGPPCLPGSRQKLELALPSQEDGGKATGQWAGPRASNCIALQGAVPSPTPMKLLLQVLPGAFLEAGTAPALHLQGAACGLGTSSTD